MRRTIATVAAAVTALAPLAVTTTAEAASPQAGWIVVLRPGAPGGPASAAAAAAAATGGRVGFVYTHALQGFSITASASAADALRRNPNVAAVVRDGVQHLLTTQPNPPSWGLDRVDQRTLPLSASYSYGPTGSGVTAFVIDTGIRYTHVDFGGRAALGYDAITQGGDGSDCNGHGTHVAGTLGGATYGVAKGVTLRSVRVLDCTGYGTDSQVIAGVDYVTGQKQASPTTPMVANMSLGGADNPTLVDSTIRSSIAAGVVYVFAAGNSSASSCDPIYSPADVLEGITVGATTKSDAQASYSNYGQCVDLYAPGGDGLFAGIVSASYTSDTGSATKSGTSMAAPHVAGAVALYLEGHPTATASDAQAWLVSGATTGALTGLGAGSPNRLLYTNPPAAPLSATAATISATRTVSKRSWSATATTTVRDAVSGAAVSGATVTLALSGGATGSKTCTTGTAGTCAVSVSLKSTATSLTFTVTGVTKTGTTWNGVPASVTVTKA